MRTEKETLSLHDYNLVHRRIRENYGKARRCESVNCKNKSATYDWALIRGKKYENKRENFMQMCRSCHIKYDMTDEIRKKRSAAGMGRKFSIESRQKISAALTGRKITSISKRTYIYTRDGTLVGEFKSATEAAKWIGVKSNRITMAIDPKYTDNKTVKGYIVSYEPLY